MQLIPRVVERAAQGGKKASIHAHRTGVLARVLIGNEYLHMAALKAAAIDERAQRFLQKAKVFRKAESRVQKAVIDGFEFQGHLAPFAADAAPAIAGHAPDQPLTSPEYDYLLL